MIKLILMLFFCLTGLIESFSNVGRGKPYWQRKAFGRIKKWSWVLSARANMFAPIHGFAEIGEADGRVNEKNLLKKNFPSKWAWRTVGLNTKTPIVIRQVRHKVVFAKLIKAAEGKAGVGPNRYLVVVIYKDRFTKELRARVNTHYHAGAWNRKYNRHDDWRQDSWTNHHILLRETVRDIVEGRGEFSKFGGVNTTVSGDFNPGWKDTRPHKRAVIAVSRDTDRIWAVPTKGYKALIWRKKIHNLGIDFHDSISVNIKYKKQ